MVAGAPHDLSYGGALRLKKNHDGKTLAHPD